MVLETYFARVLHPYQPRVWAIKSLIWLSSCISVSNFINGLGGVHLIIWTETQKFLLKCDSQSILMCDVHYFLFFGRMRYFDWFSYTYFSCIFIHESFLFCAWCLSLFWEFWFTNFFLISNYKHPINSLMNFYTFLCTRQVLDEFSL